MIELQVSNKILTEAKSRATKLGKLNNSITKKDLFVVLENIVIKNKNIDSIVACSILGGHYENDIYYSWKSNKKQKSNCCMISGLFQENIDNLLTQKETLNPKGT